MTPNELYALTPIKIDYDFYKVSNALSQISNQDDYTFAFWHQAENLVNIDEIEKEKKIEIRYYMNEGDDKYGAMLYSIFFNEQPLMIVKNDGKYYSDYDSVITNQQVLKDMEEYVKTKQLKNDDDLVNYIKSPDEDIPDLAEVSHYNLFNYYHTDVNPLYKENDIVWGYTPENHLKNRQHHVLTKVRIGKVFPFSRQETYYGTQIERNWSKDGVANQMILVKEGGCIGCYLNDTLILGKVDEIPMPAEAINNFVDESGELMPYFQGYLLEDIFNKKKSKIKP